MFAQIEHQIRAVNPLDILASLHSAHPHHRHAVRSGKERVIQNVAKYRIVLGFADAMHVGDGDIATAALPDGIKQKFAGPLLIEHANPDAEDVNSVYLGHSSRV